MEIKNIIIIIMLALQQNVIAQGSWKVQNPLPTESDLLTIEPVTDKRIFAGGLGGTLLKSDNAGETWNVQKFKNLENIRSIYFSDSLSGWLIDYKHIYYTSDGGENWHETYAGGDMSTYYFLDITCFNKTIYLFLKPQTAAVWELPNAKSLIIKSTDGGNSWVQLNQEIKGKMLCAFFLDEKDGYLYSEETVSIDESFTCFYKTNDGGETWIKSRFPDYNWTAGMYFINQKSGFTGKYKTSDGGVTWKNMFGNYLQPNQNIDDIFFTDSLNGWAISGTKIFYTTDTGTSWEETARQSDHLLTDINFSTDGTGWLVGWAGNIFQKKIAGSSWESLSKGNKANLNDLFFIDEKEGWCVGRSGCILHTTDGGSFWEKQESLVDWTLFKVRLLNKLEGWIAGYSAVLHTTNGGKNWAVRNDLIGWFVDIEFFDDKIGLLLSNKDAVFRTTDGGTNWYIVNNMPLSKRLTSIARVNESEAWIGGWAGLGHTTDKGATIQWFDIPKLLLVEEIKFVNSNTGFLCNDFGNFLKTSDGGWTWRELPRGTGLDDEINNFFALNEDTIWLYLGPGGGFIQQVVVTTL